MVALLIYLLGVITGVGMVMAYVLWQVNKFKKIKKTLLTEIKKKALDLESKSASIKERLIKAAEIAKTQMELRSQAEMPSMNAVHSRYKNGLVHEINEMEQQKMAILKTILDDGFDPTITVINESGQREDITLSAYISVNMEVKSDGDPNDPNKPRKVGKFMIHKGGKDDKGTTH